MGSKNRAPPAHQRQPDPGPGKMHPDRFGSGTFPRFEMLRSPEVMEQKVAAQHVEMQKLAFENQRLAATHGTLRQELAATQHELQILNTEIGAVKSEREQHMRALVDKIAYMEAELKTAEPLKSELHKFHAEAQILVVARQELLSKVHQLDQELQKAHIDVQHIPALMSELESLRHENQHFRSGYMYEKKLYNDHLESLQVMEKNYITMAREVEKLQGELTNYSNVDRRTCGPYVGMSGKDENGATAHPVGQKSYQDTYGVPQGHVSFPLPTGAVGAQSGSVPARAGYDAQRGPGYESYDPTDGSSYDALGHGYGAQKGPGYDPQRGAVYDPQRGHISNLQTGAGYNASKSTNYNSAAATGATMPH